MSALSPTDPDIEFDFDFDKNRAARREARQRVPALRIAGQRYELPLELPVDVLEPLADLNMDVSLLIRQVLDVRKQAVEDGEAQNEALLGAVIDMLVVNPSLPRELVAAVKEMAQRLLGPSGYTALAAARPTVPDLGAVMKYIAAQYGVGLGEASRSSDSSDGSGTTSSLTSGGEAATSATSGGHLPTLAS